MIVELIYTSAPETLDGPGYGVVSKTEDMPGRLEKFLRQLNRYDYELSAGGDQGHDGPTVFSQTTTTDGKDVWHVLSRVGFGGYDYTYRAVFLAHHVAIKATDLRGIRVADLLRSPSLFVTQWDGPVGLRPKRPIPVTVRSDRGRDLWKSIAGHPDWARTWVDLWTRHEGQPCFLATPPNADIMELFAAASALLDPESANKISILSHMDIDRPGIRYDWIGLSAGANFARSIAGRFPERTMDLGRPLGASPPPPMIVSSGLAPAPTSPDRPRSKATAVQAAQQALDDYWTQEPAAAPGPRQVAARPIVGASPPPPPAVGPGLGARVMMAAGGLVVVAGLVGAAFWAGRNGRVEQKPLKVESTLALNPPTEPEPSPKREVEPPKPEEKRSPTPFPQVGQGGPSASADAQSAALAKALESKPPLPFRLDYWPLKRLALNAGSATPVSLVNLPGTGYSKLQLLTPDGSDIKVEKQDGGTIDIALQHDLGPASERIQLVLVPAQTAKPASIEARLVGPTSANSLLKRLQFCVLRVRSTTQELLATDQPLDLYFAPTLPEIPLNGAWECSDESLKQGATEFFEAMAEATRRQNALLKPKLQPERISLSILPEEASGWPLLMEGTAPWLAGKHLTARFVVKSREGKSAKPWEFTLKLSTNFGSEAKIIESELSLKGKPKVNETKPEAKTGEKSDKVPGAPDKPDQPKKGESGRAAFRKNRDKEKNQTTENTVPEPPQPVSPQDDGDVVYELFRRFGRAGGSITIPVKLRTPDQPDGPEELLQILRFGAAPFTPNK